MSIIEKDDFDWHYYEGSAERCMQRLIQIADEAGVIGKFLSRSPADDLGISQKELILALTSWANESRVPGFCGLKLAEEGMILIHQVAACVAVLRKIYEAEGKDEKLAHLNRMTSYCNNLGQVLQQTISDLAPFRNLDGKEIFQDLVQKIKSGT